MPGRINETYDQMHDYDIASYKVDFENMRLIITACSGKGDICDIIFTGLLAHKFENVGRQNILFDICNDTVPSQNWTIGQNNDIVHKKTRCHF